MIFHGIKCCWAGPGAWGISMAVLLFCSERFQERVPQHAAGTLQEGPGAAAGWPGGVPARELAQLPALHWGGRVSVPLSPGLAGCTGASCPGNSTSSLGKDVRFYGRSEQDRQGSPELLPSAIVQLTAGACPDQHPENRGFCLSLADLGRDVDIPTLLKAPEN